MTDNLIHDNCKIAISKTLIFSFENPDFCQNKAPSILAARGKVLKVKYVHLFVLHPINFAVFQIQ